MTYERDEYMRRQEAEHAMIAMRDPRKALNQIAGMPWASGRPSPADACTEMQAIARTASDEMRADENAWPERAIRVAEALEHEVGAACVHRILVRMGKTTLHTAFCRTRTPDE